MQSFTKNLITELWGLADVEKAVAMKAYMKNQFKFLGIPTPERRKILKEHLKQNLIKDEPGLNDVVKELWMLPEREFQYCSMETLLFYKRLWQQGTIEVIECLITGKSWWDTADFIAYDCAGTYFKMFPDSIKSITGRWNHSNHIWLQRSSLLFQKSCKKMTDTQLLSKYILHIASSKEFFIQKAIGWILREYAKTDAEWVRNFVKNNTLAPLSQREAMKHF